MKHLLAALILVALASPAAATPRVVASIMPVHSIVAAVMGEVGQPELLFKGSLSEHTASLTPSQVATLGEADLVFMISHTLEFKLGELSGSEAVNGRNFIELAQAPGLTLLPIRQGQTFEPDPDAPAPSAESDGLVLTFDPHIWLDPENAKAMASAVAQDLAQADPANAAAYARNARTFATSLDVLAAELTTGLEPLKGKAFIVFHDAYHYFEHRFGLVAAGSIADVSAVSPSAARLSEIRAKLVATGALCVFREPQFDDKYIRVIIEGTSAREGILDGLGASLHPGPGAYGEILAGLARNLKSCLAP